MVSTSTPYSAASGRRKRICGNERPISHRKMTDADEVSSASATCSRVKPARSRSDLRVSCPCPVPTYLVNDHERTADTVRTDAVGSIAMVLADSLAGGYRVSLS